MLLDPPRRLITKATGDMPAGSVFAGHLIEAVAGRGGMGVVYRARQLSLERTVALKVIAPALTQDPAIRRRFLRESRVAASIDHPNVIPIYYTGEEGETAFIAMRHVAGDDLRTLVRRETRLRPARAAGIVAQVGAALDAAHAAGLVHRDVKPANVLLGPDEHAYLTDFGLTKHVLSEPGPTRNGNWVGTLDFVAPEQIRGERVDARADVYGLGCLLHYALTGRPPFARDTDEAKLWAHLSEPPPRPSEARAGGAAGARRGRRPRTRQVARRALPVGRRPRPRRAGRRRRRPAAGRERMVAVGAAAPVEVETRTAALPAAPIAPRRRRVLPAAATRRRRDDRRGRVSRHRATTGASPRAPPRPRRSKSVRIGGRLNAIAAAGGRIWTGAFLHGRLDAVDPATARRLERPRPKVGIGLNGLAASGDTLWAVASRDRRLVRLGARNGRQRGRAITLPAAVNALAADPDSVWVVVSTDARATDDLLRYDAATGKLRQTIPVTWGVRRDAARRRGAVAAGQRPRARGQDRPRARASGASCGWTPTAAATSRSAAARCG